MAVENCRSIWSITASGWWVHMASDIDSWLTGADGVLTPAQSILGAIQG